MTVVAAPSVEQEQLVSHRGYVLLVFAGPLLLASLLEAGFALVSDRVPRRRLVALGLMALSGSLALCALAESATLLSLALGVAGTASGVACGAAQAELVTRDPAAADRTLTRWVMFGGIGDVLTPLVIGVVLWLGGSYHGALWVAALVIAVQALLVRTGPAPSAVAAPLAVSADDAEPEVPLGQALRDGARNGRLWLWLFGAALCTLLDEIVVALTTLHLERDLGTSPAAAAGYAAALSFGGVVGAFMADRALACVSSTRVLVACASVCSVSLVLVLASDSAGWMLPALVLVGMSAAPQYALLQARAYAAVPGRPGVVNALSEVFVLLDILAPVALGVVADRFGLELALACLLTQPLCVLALVLVFGDRRGRPRRTRGKRLDRRHE